MPAVGTQAGRTGQVTRSIILILTPTFMSGSKNKEKMGFIPIKPFWSGLLFINKYHLIQHTGNRHT